MQGVGISRCTGDFGIAKILEIHEDQTAICLDMLASKIVKKVSTRRNIICALFTTHKITVFQYHILLSIVVPVIWL